MRLIYKNIAKSYLFNFLNLFSIILFGVASLIMTLGFLATPLKINQVVNQVTKRYQKWDYTPSNDWSSFNNSFMYNYFFNIDSRYFVNSFNEPLLNLNKVIPSYSKDGKPNSNTKQLQNHLIDQYNISDTSQGITFTKWLIDEFYKNSLNLNAFEDNLVPIGTTWFLATDFFNATWLNFLQTTLFNPLPIIYKDLLMEFNGLQKNKFDFDSNFLINFEATTSVNGLPTNIMIDDSNVGKSDNVVPENKKIDIKKLANNEVLIGSKYAHDHGLKVNDVITISAFYNKDGTLAPFNSTYIVKGFGLKPSTLVSNNGPNLPIDKDKNNNKASETLILFTNHTETLKYYQYIGTNFNVAYNHDKAPQKSFSYNSFKQRLTLREGANLTEFRDFLQKIGAGNNFDFQKFNNSNYSPYLAILQTQIKIVLLIGLILLIIMMVFINVFVKGRLNSLRNQIGIMEAFGYSSWLISGCFGLLIWATFLIVSILGYLLSIPLQIFTNNYFTENLLFYVTPVNTSALVLSILLLVLPLFLGILSWFYATWKIHKSPLTLIYAHNSPVFRNKQSKNKKYNPKKLTLFHLHQTFGQATIGSQLVFFGLFFLASLLLLCEFSAKPILLSTTDQLFFYTKLNVDHKDGFNKNHEWQQSDETNGDQTKLTFENGENFALKITDYDKKSDLLKWAQNPITNKIRDYINIDRSQGPAGLKMIILDLISLNINYQTLDVSLINEFLETFEKDYLNYWKNDANMKTLNDILVNNLKPKIVAMTKHRDPQVSPLFLTFNNVFYNPQQEAWSLSIDLIDENNNYYMNNFQLKAINSHFYDFLKLRTVSKEQLAQLEDSRSYQNNVIPIIIGSQLAIKNKVQIGTLFTMSIETANLTKPKLNFKVIAINEADNVSNFFYTNFELFKKFFLAENIQQKFLGNEIYSCQKSITAFDGGLNNLKKVRFNNDFVNYTYFPPTFNQFQNYEISVRTFFEHLNDTDSLVNLPFANKNFESFGLMRTIIANQVENIFYIFTVLEICEILMTIIITLLLITHILDKRSREVAMLKILGYSNWQIIYLIFSNYLILIWISFILSAFLMSVLLKVVQQIFSKVNNINLIYSIPLSHWWLPILFIFLCSTIVIIIPLLAMKKMNLKDLE